MDHGRIECVVSIKGESMHGKGVWKLNISLLEDERIRDKYVCLFNRLKRRVGDFKNVVEWWEWVKGCTKAFFIRKGCEKARSEREMYEGWQKRLEYLEGLRKLGENVKNELVEARERVNECLEKEVKIF